MQGRPKLNYSAAALSLFTLLFAARVLAQALQYWTPVPFLPPFGAFQGSNLPYWALLPAQLVILAAMIRASIRAWRGELRPNPRLKRALAWTGGVYLAGSIARIVIGLAIPEAPDWFRAWISAALHIVLASFVLVLSAFYGEKKGEVE